MHKTITKVLPFIGGAAIGVVISPDFAFAGGGDPISTAGGNAVDIGVGLGALACACGVIGTCAGGLMRSSGVMAGGAITAVCGGAWAGAPQLVQQVIGAAAGFSVDGLNAAAPSFASIISAIFG